MSEARTRRLTREALGPQRPRAYTKFDDALLRAIGIVALVVTIVVFASWPRDDWPAQRQASKPRASSTDVMPVAQRAHEAPRTDERTPVY